MPVDQATVDHLRKHDWGADPFEPHPAVDEPFRIKLVEGRCFFLDRENRCRIHSELSYEAKPAVCRAFPLAVLEVAGKPYARLSFWCPTVTANCGKPVAHQSRWLKEVAKYADRRTRPISVNGTDELTPRDFERVHQALRRLLLETALPVGDRLAAAATLIQRFGLASSCGDAAVLVERVLRTAHSEGAAAFTRASRGQGHPSQGRRVLSLYLLQDRRAGRLAVVGRLLSILLFNLGIARLRSRAVSARAGWRQVRRVAFIPVAAGAELLTRYFIAKLDSRRYLAGDATLVSGFNVLVAAHGVIDLLARMRAASDGRSVVDDADVEVAVRAADLLVVEHRGQDRTFAHSRLARATLGDPDLCADIRACLDGRE